jgi:hypothetical protein
MGFAVPADFARTLERELAEAKAEELRIHKEKVDHYEARLEAERRLSQEQRSDAKAEVRLDDDRGLDEVCAPGGHLERLDDGHWFLEVGDVAVWLHSHSLITASFERREPGKWLENEVERLTRERNANAAYAEEFASLAPVVRAYLPVDHPVRDLFEAALATNPTETAINNAAPAGTPLVVNSPNPVNEIGASPKPVCWFRTKNGELDWGENCVGTHREDVADGWIDSEEGYGAIPLYTHPAPALKVNEQGSSSGPVEFAVWEAGGEDIEFYAQVNGPRETAMNEARHYAAQVVSGGYTAIIEEVTRREVERLTPPSLSGTEGAKAAYTFAARLRTPKS